MSKFLPVLNSCLIMDPCLLIYVHINERKSFNVCSYISFNLYITVLMLCCVVMIKLGKTNCPNKQDTIVYKHLVIDEVE